MPVRAVFFDVGETLVDEERYWRELAARLGLQPHVVWAALGVTIERGEDHRELWGYLGLTRPDLVDEIAYTRADLYPDAIACLAACREAGLLVGLAGNQSEVLERWLREECLPADVVTSSAGLGVRKPARAFFERLVALAGCEAGEVAYVGDRVDFDVRPARAAGLVAVHLRRGPWGRLQRDGGAAHAVVDDLGGIPAVLAGVAPEGGAVGTGPPSPGSVQA